MMYAQYIAAQAFNSGGLGIIHSISHAVSAFYDTHHGVVEAVVGVVERAHGVADRVEMPRPELDAGRDVLRVHHALAARDYAGEAQFRTFASVMPNHVWSATPDGKLDWFNHQVHEYTGAPIGELDGDRWGAVVHPEDRERAVAAWTKAVREGSNYEVEFRLRNAAGTYRWHLARAMPIRDAAGRVVRWVGTNTDMDDQMRIEAALRDREADLARVQQIGKVGGVEVVLDKGFRNRRSPEYLEDPRLAA